MLRCLHTFLASNLPRILAVSIIAALLLPGCAAPLSAPASSDLDAALTKTATITVSATAAPTRTRRPSETPPASPTPEATLTPTATVVPSATIVPSVTPIPTATFLPEAPILWTDGWGNSVVQTLCLEYSQGGVEGAPELPVRDLAANVLPRLGLRVVAPGEECQGTLRLAANLTAWSSDYVGSGTCFSGGEVEMSAVLAFADGQADLPVSGLSYLLPTASIEGCAASEAEAPFGQIWQSALFSVLGQIWGDTLIARVWDMPGLPESDRLAATRLTWTTQSLDTVLPVLQQAAQSPDPVARLGVLEAVTRWIPRTREVQLLLNLINTAAQTADPRVARAALETVAMLDGGRADLVVPVAIQAAASADPGIQVLALQKLGSVYCGTQPVIDAGLDGPLADAVIAQLADADPPVQVAAIAAVHNCMWSQAAPGLIALLAQGDPQVAPLAQQTLEHITGQQFGADPAAWQAWWDASIAAP